MKYIYHHLGLGDHFICNGLVRHYYAQYGDITLFCKDHLKSHIEFMYRDLKNLIVFSLNDDKDVLEYIHKENIQSDLIVVGFDKTRQLLSLGYSFDETFYVGQDIPFSIRFSKFYIERDKPVEKALYSQLIKPNEKYVFIHDDNERGMNIDNNLFNSSYKIIRNDKKHLIMDYLTLLENATEIHLMQSCFKDMINSYVMPNPKIFLHNYVRGYNDFANSKGLNTFSIINR